MSQTKDIKPSAPKPSAPKPSSPKPSNNNDWGTKGGKFPITKPKT